MRDSKNITHRFNSQALDIGYVEVMLLEKAYEPVVNDIIVGRGAGYIFSSNFSQSVDDAIAHGGDGQAG